MAQILIESEALDSLKRMVEELERKKQSLLDAHYEILRVHANDNHRPKAFYISADAYDSETEVQS